MKENFNVYGMSCAACSGRVDQTVRKLDIVKEVSVNLLTGKMQVEYIDGETDAEKCEKIVCEAVKKSGYTAIAASKDTGDQKGKTPSTTGASCPIGGDCGEKPKKKWSASTKRLIASIVFLIILVYITMGKMFGLPHPDFVNSEINPHINALVQMVLALLVIICARKMYVNGWRNLFRLSPNMDTLISVGSSISFVYSLVYLVVILKNYSDGNTDLACEDVHKLFFESAAMIPTFISIGKYLEERSKIKTTDALRKLINMRPATAILYKDGEEKVISISEVKSGDILAVKPGATIPCDGSIVFGEGSIDESMLTGESLPVEKEIGASVFEATINQNGYFRMKAEKTGENTVFSQIIKLVEEASSSKAPIQRLADKISLYFVPIVLGISLLTFAIWMMADGDLSFAISMAVSVMVISCPCSLGLATPTAIMAGTGKGAELGVLIKSAESLEKLHGCDTFLFDKTGTITYGRLSVNSVIPGTGVSEKELINLAGSLEVMSQHPIALAITEYASSVSGDGKNEDVEFTEFNIIPGGGIEAKGSDGASYFAGNYKKMPEGIRDGLSQELKGKYDELNSTGNTAVFIAKDSKVLGLISVSDIIKEDSKETIGVLKELGVKPVMLTGDNSKTAAYIGKKAGVEEVYAELTPKDKEEKLSALQGEGHVIAMVGDGINDAPSLLAADVGIAMGTGTDIAVDSADIVIIGNELNSVATAFELSRATMRTIKQNLFWAFFYNVIGIPIAAGVLYPAFGLKLNPMIAAACMSLSSLFVVSNALRLRFFSGRSKIKAVDDVNVKNYATAEGDKTLVTDSTTTDNDRIKETEKEVIESTGGDKDMEVRVIVDGMMCTHCTGRVEAAFNAVDGIEAKVTLEDKTALLKLSKDFSDAELTKVVTDAGYKVTEIIR